jgi:hypothetical protein
MAKPQKVVARIAKHIEVELGDTKQDDWFPQVKTKHWKHGGEVNECNFSMRLVDGTPGDAEVKFQGSTTTWQKEPSRKVVLKQTLDNLDFEVHLLTPPVSNEILFTIQHKGLDFYYQSHEFTADELEMNPVRPDNVKGSYAVYHSTKANNEYMAGKAFHLFRPQATDALGATAWCEIYIDTDAGTLRVTVPQNFLDTATYPVVVT